jgi:hypothetical protein
LVSEREIGVRQAAEFETIGFVKPKDIAHIVEVLGRSGV